MTSRAEVKQRVARGQQAAPGTFIDLLDDADGLDQLFHTYLSLQNGTYDPGEMAGVLTDDEFKRNVRLVHDAIRSTAEAEDAFKKDKNGRLVKTPVMRYIDGVGMFEIQLVAGKLVKTVHGVQRGELLVPSWPTTSGLKLHNFGGFQQRMDSVIRSLKTRKAICKALFFEEVTMAKRVSMQPSEESDKKGQNTKTNQNRDEQLVFARKNMPKGKKPGTAATGTGAGDGGDDDDDDNDDENASKESPPVRPAKRPRRAAAGDAVTLASSLQRRADCVAARLALPAVDTPGSAQPDTQPDTPSASVPTSAGGLSQPGLAPAPAPEPTPAAAPTAAPTAAPATAPAPAQVSTVATGTAFKPINAAAINQRAQPAAPASGDAAGQVEAAPDASPDAMDTDDPNCLTTPNPAKISGSKHADLFVGPAFIDQAAQVKAAFAGTPMGQGGLSHDKKFPDPFGEFCTLFDDQEPPPAYTPAGNFLPQQPQRVQSPGQYLPQQYRPLDNYASNQRDSNGSQQNSPPGFGIPQPNQESQMRGSENSIAQGSPHSKISQNQSGININGRVHRSQPNSHAADSQPSGKVANFQQSGRMPSIQHNAIRQSGSHSYIVNNYFQHPKPFESLASDILAITQGADDPYPPRFEQAIGYDETIGRDQNFDGYVHGYAKTLPDDEAEDNCQGPLVAALPAPKPPQYSWSATPTVVGQDDTPAIGTTVSPVSKTPSLREVDEAAEYGYTDEEYRRMEEIAGLKPPRGGDVYTGEVSMFPSTLEDDFSAIKERMDISPAMTASVTSAGRPEPWMPHLRDMDPIDRQAFIECAGVSYGIAPSDELGKRGTDPAVVPSVFVDEDEVGYEDPSECGVDTKKVDKPSDVNIEAEDS